MKKNPFLKVESKLNRIYGNIAILNFVTVMNTYDEMTGNVIVERQFTQKEIAYSDPHVFNESVENKTLYLTGDMTFNVARYDIVNILPSFRTPTIETCGIDMKNDFFIISGSTYRIISMKPKTMWVNVPALYKIQVRECSQVINGDL